jgi:hypothetical protein
LKVEKVKNMKATFGALLLAAVSFSATAQKVENDDMYFTAKDRARVKAVTVSAANSIVQSERNVTRVAEPENEVGLNPTDSYSARNINPDYSVASGKQASGSKADYFIEDYRPTGVNGNLNGNYSANSPNSQYSYYNNNPYAFSPYSAYGSMGMGYTMGGMYPMDMYGMRGYGYPYSSYGYGSAMSMSYGMNFGYNPWMSSAMGFGYGMYYDPFMMSSMYCPYSFYGYNSAAYSSYYYPGTVVDNRVNGPTVAHGRRSERSSSESYQAADGTRQTVTQSRTGRTLSNGRARSTDNTQAYYERGWKNNNDNTGSGRTQGTATRSYWSSPDQSSGNQSSPSRSNSSRRSDGSSWGTSWDNSNSGSSWNTGGNTRSSWNGGSSSVGSSSMGGTRSSGGSSSGGGHTRGRD